MQHLRVHLKPISKDTRAWEACALDLNDNSVKFWFFKANGHCGMFAQLRKVWKLWVNHKSLPQVPCQWFHGAQSPSTMPPSLSCAWAFRAAAIGQIKRASTKQLYACNAAPYSSVGAHSCDTQRGAMCINVQSVAPHGCPAIYPRKLLVVQGPHLGSALIAI